MRYFNFSFDFGDPYIDFGGYRWAFRVFTPENTYAVDPARATLEPHANGLTLRAGGLIWAGGQERAEGGLTVELTRHGDVIEWRARASHATHPVKSMAALVNGVPRGQVAWYDGDFFDPGQDEYVRYYPFGGKYSWSNGMASPLMFVRPGAGRVWFAHALDNVVRTHRFYLQPDGETYHAEFISEERAYEWSNEFQAPPWRLGWAASPAEVYAYHQAHLEAAFGLAPFDSRRDCPAWARDIQLVLNLHGVHWTGFIFNTFSQMLEILRWVAERIDPHRVLVYLPAWDGRYYWHYPVYEPDPRLGGPEGFRRLITQGQALGFKFMPMFGINCASGYEPSRAEWGEGLHQWPDGADYWIEWTDWDCDRDTEKWQMLMNIGSPAWRGRLLERASATVREYGVDAVFFDIAHFWVNDARYDMYEGTRLLCAELRRRHPGLLITGEKWYDAQIGLFPFVQGKLPPPLYPQAMMKYGRPFSHLDHPAPGRGSSGVHELGFHPEDLANLGLNAYQIPTLAIVDDTFEKHRDVMAEVIEIARTSPPFAGTRSGRG